MADDAAFAQSPLLRNCLEKVKRPADWTDGRFPLLAAPFIPVSISQAAV